LKGSEGGSNGGDGKNRPESHCARVLNPKLEGKNGSGREKGEREIRLSVARSEINYNRKSTGGALLYGALSKGKRARWGRRTFSR